MGDNSCNYYFNLDGNIFTLISNAFSFFLENQSVEKRLAITPEISKKYISLGFKVSLPHNYGLHLGFGNEDYINIGVNLEEDEQKILDNADIIVQLGLLDDKKISSLKRKSNFNWIIECSCK